MRRGLVLAVLALLLTAWPAHADFGDHTHVPVIDEVTPTIDGLEIELRAEPAPTLVVRNRTGETVEVLDLYGEPFLRIGPDDVQADVSSPEFFRSESPSSYAPVPPSATDGDGDEPRFVTLVDGGEWAWFEHRITYTPKDVTWRIPLRVGGTDVTVAGGWDPVTVPARVVAVIDPVAIDGLYVAVLEGPAPGLFVGNDTGEAFVVDDQRGEPFLRIGPERTTRAKPGGDAEVVAPTPDFGWIEPRVGWQGDPPDDEETQRWEVPARLGERDVVLTGTVTWDPIDDGGGGVGLSRLLVGGLVAVPLAAALIVWRTAGKRDKGV